MGRGKTKKQWKAISSAPFFFFSPVYLRLRITNKWSARFLVLQTKSWVYWLKRALLKECCKSLFTSSFIGCLLSVFLNPFYLHLFSIYVGFFFLSFARTSEGYFFMN